MQWIWRISLFLVTAGLWTDGYAVAADSYYQEPPLFSTAPSPEKSLQTIARFGPVGIGIDLIQPATVIPMASSVWQAKQDPDNAELQTEDDKFRYNGRFVANPETLALGRSSTRWRRSTSSRLSGR